MFTRPELETLIPYTPGEQPGLGEVFIKLNTNENPYPPSPKILSVWEDILKNGLLRKYPSFDSSSLRHSIAKRWNLNPDSVLITNGSDEALRLLFFATLGPGDSVVCPDPTYSYYSVLVEQAMVQANLEKVPLLPDLHFDFEKKKKKKGKLLAFANPNAPTGILENKKDLLGLVEKFPGLVLSDEAYIDFAERDASLLSHLKEFPNLVITRTFSKSYSLAGLRVGFLIANPELVQKIHKLKDSYNVGMLEQKIAEVAFEDETYFQDNIEKIKSDRIQLTSSLREKGFEIPESSANFIFCKPPKGKSPKSLYEGLKSKGILVRYFGTGISQNYIRITIGSRQENSALLDGLTNLL